MFEEKEIKAPRAILFFKLYFSLWLNLNLFIQHPSYKPEDKQPEFLFISFTQIILYYPPILTSFFILFIWSLFLLVIFCNIYFVCVYIYLFALLRTELHSLQGMEFLEGFGKKKQQPHQQLNNLSSIHINPLSTQSLSIHQHGIPLSFIEFFYFLCFYFLNVSNIFFFVSIELGLS